MAITSTCRPNASRIEQQPDALARHVDGLEHLVRAFPKALDHPTIRGFRASLGKPWLRLVHQGKFLCGDRAMPISGAGQLVLVVVGSALLRCVSYWHIGADGRAMRTRLNMDTPVQRLSIFRRASDNNVACVGFLGLNRIHSIFRPYTRSLCSCCFARRSSVRLLFNSMRVRLSARLCVCLYAPLAGGKWSLGQTGRTTPIAAASPHGAVPVGGDCDNGYVNAFVA